MEKLTIEPKHVLNKVRLALSMDLKLAQMKSEDGSVVFEAESFEAEFSVGIVTEEGIMPAPAGEYMLEDGSTMVVETDGVIASIGMKEAEAEPEVEAEAEAPTTETPKKVVESVTKETFFSKEDAETFLAEHEVALSKIKTLEEEKAELEVKLKEAESVKPIKHNPEKGKVSLEEMTPLQRHRAIKQKLNY